MPQVGTVTPSYASCTIALRSMAYDSAHRTCGLSNGACAFWTIIARGHGSNHAYGASLVHALTFGLRCAKLRKEPCGRMPMFGVSRSFEASARATLSGLPL